MINTISYINSIDLKKVERHRGIEYKPSISETNRKRTHTNIIMRIEQVTRNDKQK